MKIAFDKLVSRSVVNFLTRELKLSGVRMDADTFLMIAIIGGFALFVSLPFIINLGLKIDPIISALVGIVATIVYEAVIYVFLEFKIDQRKNFVENILPDYLQLTAANIRSGIALDKAMALAARPEFTYFSEDIKELTKKLYAGVTLQNALTELSRSYRSPQLQHTIRMITESIMYGGGMTDLLNQIAKDMRNQRVVEKEVAGQLFMYTLFIGFATVIGAPVLYGLTAEMITVTDSVWAGILQQNPGGLPTVGISFLKPSPPQITIAMYHNFALASVLIITGFGAFIVSVVSSGTMFKGLKYMPVFMVAGVIVFYVTSIVIGGLFGSISGI
ncbi:Type II secretion system (T2SS), protein F [uncultured archaeon]|nr:Type II secretion system (T2SS), protein F [uncultured archaeon]